jgi:hypothetical protein
MGCLMLVGPFFLIGFLCGAITATLIRRTNRKQLWIGVAAALLVAFFGLAGPNFMGLLSAAIVLILMLSGLLLIAIFTT